jgi:hypothetical protein
MKLFANEKYLCLLECYLFLESFQDYQPPLEDQGLGTFLYEYFREPGFLPSGVNSLLDLSVESPGQIKLQTLNHYSFVCPQRADVNFVVLSGIM